MDKRADENWLRRMFGYFKRPQVRGVRGANRSYGDGLRGTFVRICPGKRHAWFRTSVGLVRKPYVAV